MYLYCEKKWNLHKKWQTKIKDTLATIKDIFLKICYSYAVGKNIVLSRKV